MDILCLRHLQQSIRQSLYKLMPHGDSIYCHSCSVRIAVEPHDKTQFVWGILRLCSCLHSCTVALCSNLGAIK